MTETGDYLDKLPTVALPTITERSLTMPSNQEIGWALALFIAGQPIIIFAIIGVIVATPTTSLAKFVALVAGMVAVVVGCAYLAGLAKRRRDNDGEL